MTLTLTLLRNNKCIRYIVLILALLLVVVIGFYDFIEDAFVVFRVSDDTAEDKTFLFFGEGEHACHLKDDSFTFFRLLECGMIPTHLYSTHAFFKRRCKDYDADYTATRPCVICMQAMYGVMYVCIRVPVCTM